MFVQALYYLTLLNRLNYGSLGDTNIRWNHPYDEKTSFIPEQTNTIEVTYKSQ